jgi:hypothetical protein
VDEGAGRANDFLIVVVGCTVVIDQPVLDGELVDGHVKRIAPMIGI